MASRWISDIPRKGIPGKGPQNRPLTLMSGYHHFESSHPNGSLLGKVQNIWRITITYFETYNNLGSFCMGAPVRRTEDENKKGIFL